jgi:hypothetical protein
LRGALHAILEAARGLPDLLKARREVMEARWQSENDAFAADAPSSSKATAAAIARNVVNIVTTNTAQRC